MTHEDTLRYTAAVQDYEKHKKHLYIFPHDGLNPIKYLKALFSDMTIILLVIGGYVICTLLLGLFFGFLSKSYMGSIRITAILLLAFIIFSAIINYFLYLNYVDGFDSENIGGYLFMFVCVLGTWSGVHKLTENIWWGVFAAFIVMVLGILITKAIFFEKQNERPSINDYDSALK